MLNDQLCPLRRISATSVPVAEAKKGVAAIEVLYESPELRKLSLNYLFPRYSSLNQTRTVAAYSDFFPQLRTDTALLTPGPGVTDLPIPQQRPFPTADPVASIAALADDNPDRLRDGRQLLLQLRLRLERPALVGGICFGGFPFLLGSRSARGLSSTNFGLPREWRLTCAPGSGTAGQPRDRRHEFLDSEVSATLQQSLWHSGFHYLCCDPVFTNSLVLTLSDFPYFPGVVAHGQLSRGTLLRLRPELSKPRRFGFLVPYLYVFEYQETTRYEPRVPFGVLSPASLGETSIVQYDGHYYPFTAASLGHGGREYPQAAPPSHLMRSGELQETYVSPLVQPNDSRVLWLEQSEEFDRCLSGVRLLLPFIPREDLAADLAEAQAVISELYGTASGGSLAGLAVLPRDQLEAALRLLFKLPSDVNFCEKVRLRVWEVDPPEGVAAVDVPLGGKYSALLSDAAVTDLRSIINTWLTGVPFRRPTSSRYLALEVTNIDEAPGQLVVLNLQLIQSAHVTVQPRLARTRRVRAMHFRIVGDRVGEDLGALGTRGFNLSVERWVGSDCKSVLFRASSLQDFIHAGVVRVQANSRRRATELEVSTYGAATNQALNDFRQNIDVVGSTGWHRAECGQGVNWTDPGGRASIAPATMANHWGESDFHSVSSQEVRTLVKHLYPDTEAPAWNGAAIFANGLTAIYALGDLANALATGDQSGILIPTYQAMAPGSSGVDDIRRGFDRPWRGISGTLRVTGLVTIVQSPTSVVAMSSEAVNRFLDGVQTAWDLMQDVLDGGEVNLQNVTDTLVDALSVGGAFGWIAGSIIPSPVQPFLSIIPALNGLTINPSLAAFGLGASFGSAPGSLLPVVSQNASSGTDGTVSKQASQAGYSYSQSLLRAGDQRTHHEGLMKRGVTRLENTGDQSRVRGAEVVWQGRVTDVVSGTIPIDLTLPALASKQYYASSDHSLRVRLGSGVPALMSVDIWFDVIEEAVRDDH